MYNLKPEIFDFKSVQGFSMKQLEEHYKLYTGYVAKLNEIWNIPFSTKEYQDSNPTFSKMRSIKLSETYSLDGLKLHNLYFENMTGGNKVPYGPLLNAISTQFTSFDNFISYFTDVGLSMRGWAIVALDSIDNKFHVFGSDSHDKGAVWQCYPIIVLDVYEHAYFIDFGTDRKKYINTFFHNLNWDILNMRFKNYLSLLDTTRFRIVNKCPFKFV